MSVRKLPAAAIVALIVAVVAFDVFVLPPAVRFFFGGERRGSVLPPLATDPPTVVRLLAGAPGPDVQILLKTVKDAADQNAFHDATMNRRVLGLGFERWRFYQLVVANFSRSESYSVDLGATPLDVRFEGSPVSVRAHTAEEVLAEAPPGVARSGAFVLASLGRGAGSGVDGPDEGRLPPHSISTWLVALPADRVDASGGRLASATLRARADGSGGATLAPATVRKSALDDFLISPLSPLETVMEGVQLSLRSGAAAEPESQAEPAEEYAPR